MAKQELLNSLTGGDTATFISLLQRHGNKQSNVDLQEVLSEFSRTQHEFLWASLHMWVNEQLSLMVDQDQSPEAAKVDNEGTNPEPMEEEVEKEDVAQKELYNEHLVSAILDLAYIYISSVEGKEIFIPDKLLELTVLLYGMVTVFEGVVQESIIALCELWWKKGLDEREHLVLNILPVLLDAVLVKTARRRDVQRLWALRDSLQVAPLCDPECQLLVEKLVACSANAIFLSCDEGIKWLAGLFMWRFMVIPLHRGMKTVLPECTRAQSAKCAEVYFRAWKNSQGDLKQMIEEECIQDLMYAAVHVDPMAGRLSANLHHFLHHFHRNKKHYAVATMIFNLYDPFIWRSLKAANGFVRMNATGLLCDAFPLSDGTVSQEEREELMEKQYHTINGLLVDPCHLVRITAIKGVCNILANYWLMIPSNVIKVIFRKLLSELLCDASSAAVRTEVIKGLSLLLDSNDAVPFLKEVLPRMADTFDDINANVRVAFIKLLLKVKSLKIVRYWDIVPMNHILHRLEDDTPVICKLITQLVLNTFHPLQKEDQELMHRTLALLEENRAAARRFYQYTSRKLDLADNVHFILLILRCIRNYLLTRQAHDDSQESDNDSNTTNPEVRPNPSVGSQKNLQLGLGVAPDDKENRVPSQRNPNSVAAKESEERKDVSDDEQDAENETSPLDNPDVIGGLFDTIVLIWTTNAHRLVQPQNEKYIEALRTRTSKSMPLFFKAFKDNEEVSQTLLYLSSFLPKSLVPTVVSHCLSRLRGLKQEQAKEESYVTYVNALCNWNRIDDILELATEWLNGGFKAAVISNTKERRRSNRGVRFQEESVPQPILALHLVSHILQHPLNKLAALGQNRHLLLQMAENMETVKNLVNERLEQTEEFSTLCSDRFLCECWKQYLSLITVLHKLPPDVPESQSTRPSRREAKSVNSESSAQLNYDSIATVSSCIDWSRRVLVPALGEEESGKRKMRAGEDAPALAISALSDLMTCNTNLIIVGSATPSFVYRVCGFAEELLKTDASEKFWLKSLILAKEALEFLEVYGPPNYDLEEIGGVSPIQLINTCLSSMSDFFKEQKLSQDVGELTDTLAMLLASFGEVPCSGIINYLVSTVIDHLCWHVDKVKGVNTEIQSAKEMDGFIAMVMGVCQKREKLGTSFMKTLTKLATSLQDITSLLACIYLIMILTKDSGKISRYNLKQAVIGVDSVMSRIASPAVDEENEREETVYEQYSKTSKDLLQNLKDELGVI